MKKSYENPLLEVTAFTVEDVVTVSGEVNPTPLPGGEDGDTTFDDEL